MTTSLFRGNCLLWFLLFLSLHILAGRLFLLGTLFCFDLWSWPFLGNRHLDFVFCDTIHQTSNCSRSCSPCPYLYFGSPIMWVTYFSLPRVPFVNCCQFMYLFIPFCDCILLCFLFAALTFERNTQRTRLLLSILIHFRTTSSSKNKRWKILSIFIYLYPSTLFKWVFRFSLR